MKIALLIVMWLLVLLLTLYVILTRGEERSHKHDRFIRKIWYLIFLFGAVAYLTGNPESIISDWKSYLIVLVAFVVVDSLFFLELYLGKVGGQELRTTREQVRLTQKQLDVILSNTYHIRTTLTNYEFPLFYKSKEECFSYINELLEYYGEKSGMSVQLFTYNSEEEKEKLLSNLDGTLLKKAKRILAGNKAFIEKKDNLGLYPFNFLNQRIVVQAQTIDNDRKIVETDGEAISLLLIVFDLTVENKIEESGGINGKG